MKIAVQQITMWLMTCQRCRDSGSGSTHIEMLEISVKKIRMMYDQLPLLDRHPHIE
jgi:hypothetical protein